MQNQQGVRVGTDELGGKRILDGRATSWDQKGNNQVYGHCKVMWWWLQVLANNAKYETITEHGLLRCNIAYSSRRLHPTVTPSHENHTTSWNQQLHCSFTKALHLSSVHVLNHEIWRLWDCAMWYISIVKPTRCTIFRVYWISLYTFRTVFPSIIGSPRLYIRC
jgi:hypothetical protein